jgi:hypothetical protein
LARNEGSRDSKWLEERARDETIQFDGMFRYQYWGSTVINKHSDRGRCTSEGCINAAVPPQVLRERGWRRGRYVLVEFI